MKIVWWRPLQPLIFAGQIVSRYFRISIDWNAIADLMSGVGIKDVYCSMKPEFYVKFSCISSFHDYLYSEKVEILLWNSIVLLFT